MLTNRYGLAQNYSDGVTPHAAATINQEHGLAKFQLGPLVDLLGPGIIENPDSSSFEVSEGGGLSVDVAIGTVIAASATLGSVLMQTPDVVNVEVPASDTSYIFATIYTADPLADSRFYGLPQIVVNDTDELENAELLAEVETDGSGVTLIVDRRRLSPLSDLITNGLKNREDYDSEREYLKNELAYYNSQYWVRTTPGTGDEPVEGSGFWRSLGGGTGLSADIVAALNAATAPDATNAFVTQSVLDAHVDDAANPHGVTKAQVGLANVTNDAQLKIASNLGDLGDAADARDNLGLGGLATQDPDALTLTGDVDAGGFKVTNLADGVDPTDAATVGQLSVAAAGFAPRPPVRVATIAALPTNSRSTNTLTASTNGSINSAGIDGVTDLSVGQRVMVKNESVGANNGIYEIDVVGTAGTPWQMTRATDFDTDAEAVLGAHYPVTEGGTLADSAWYLSTQGTITLNTTALTFTRDPRSDGGEANTASNAGTEGVGLVESKVGVNLPFRSLANVDGYIGIAYNAATKSVRFALTTTNLILKSLFTAKGQILVATGSGTVGVLGVGSDGMSPIADSAEPSGIRWGNLEINPKSISTSSTSVTIGSASGTRVFVTSGDRQWYIGMRLRAAHSATEFVEGEIQSYTGGTLTLLVDYVSGAGTFSSWAVGPAQALATGTGDVVGPASAVDGNVAIFDGTTGKLLEDSGKALPAGDLVGTSATQTLGNKTLTSPTINGGSISGITDLAVADGGTGASSAGAARSNLGVAYGTTAGTVAEGNDSRLSDARTPTSHASSHQSGGGDAIKLDDLATPDDNTDLNVSTSRHGLTPKLPNDATKYLDGTGAWSVPAGGGGGAAPDYILLRDEKTAGTAGGTFTSGAWRTRDLNTEVIDSGNHCTLSSNQFQLAAGTWRIRAIAPAWGVDRHQARLQNITDATTTVTGTGSSSNSSSLPGNTCSEIVHQFTIAATKTFEIQHQCSATMSGAGFGLDGSFGTEIYTIVELQKIS